MHPKEDELVEPTEFDPEPEGNGIDSKVKDESQPSDDDWGDDDDD